MKFTSVNCEGQRFTPFTVRVHEPLRSWTLSNTKTMSETMDQRLAMAQEVPSACSCCIRLLGCGSTSEEVQLQLARWANVTDDALGECWQLLRNGQTGIMMSGQARLPRLPINKLEDAIQDFLRAAEPLLPPEEFSLTRNSAQTFLENEGPLLHKKLVEYDEEEGRNSYLEVSRGPRMRSCPSRPVLTHTNTLD